MSKKAPKITNKVGVPSSSFNFIESFFDARRQSRVLNVFVFMVFAGLIFGSLVLGFAAKSGASRLQTNLDAAQTRAKNAQDLYRQTIGISGNETLPDHLKARQDELKAATASDFDVVKVYSDILASAPSGVSITQITVGTPPDKTVPGGGAAASSTTTSTAPTTTILGGKASSTTVPAASGSTVPVAISANLESYGAIEGWMKNLQGLKYLTVTTPTPAGSPPTIQVAITGTANLAQLNGRYSKLIQSIGIDPKSSSSTTTTVKK